jgi:hypothetical protein
MFPSVQIFAVKKLLPLAGIALAGVLLLISRKRARHQPCKHKNAYSKSFQHWNSPGIFAVPAMGQTNLLAQAFGIKRKPGI